ncbi:MAG: recombinase family protein [Sphaerospermopsis sp. SIO1G1]|nr:recombinase family protein [Sphaerospermopsis sp. SIO1G1]
MKIIAYSYTNPLIETSPDQNSWGWEIDQIYDDLGDRQQLQQLINDCKQQPANYLLIRRLEELGDTLEQINQILHQLETIGIIIIATEQQYTSEYAKFRMELLKLFQQIQYQNRSRKIREGHAKNRLESVPPPGKVPYGYRRSKGKYIIDRSISPIVKDFFDHFLLYGSLRGAVRYLAKKYNKKISVTTGKRWLINPVYRGDTAYQNEEIISDTHTAIISREEAAQIDRILRRNSRLPSRTASAPHSLAGLVFCSQCQCRMTVTRVTQRYQNYEYLYLRNPQCPQNPKCRAIAYQEILEQTIAIICRDLPLAVSGINFPQLDAIKNGLNEKIVNQQKILEQLPKLIETGILDPETAKLRSYKLQTEISQLQAKIAVLPPVNLRSVAEAVSIPQFWLDLSEVERRFYLREFIRQINIIRCDKNWELELIFIF